MDLVVTHNAGFFSCCSIRLEQIVDFLNRNKMLPVSVDSSIQFDWYKKGDGDITFNYFRHYDTVSVDIEKVPVDYDHEYQFVDYRYLKYNQICGLVKKYFSPSQYILNIIQNMEIKYNLDYTNICVLFYRGNDKITETMLCGYSDYSEYAYKVLKLNPETIFLLQSDETEFLEYFTKLFPNNSFYFKDEIRHMNKTINTVDKVFPHSDIYSKFYLAITIIMSKCRYIVCGSGNCSIWIMFYRGNANNVFQNLNGLWLEPINSPEIREYPFCRVPLMREI